jgi:acetyl esterase/lipase
MRLSRESDIPADPRVRNTGRLEQFGAPRLELEVAGRHGFLLLPESRARPMPWVWYAPHFDGTTPRDIHTWICTRLLAEGVAFAGVDVGESYGNPVGRGSFSAFHQALVPAYDLAAKPSLLGQSRGALMHYNWAVEHPKRVLRIAGIYPVCDLAAWPGVSVAAEAYGLTPQQLEAALPQHNPIERLAPLAAARVPIFHVHGDADELIPLPQHSAEVAQRYRALGGPMELLIVPGAGHEEISAFFQCPRLVEFLLRG